MCELNGDRLQMLVGPGVDLDRLLRRFFNVVERDRKLWKCTPMSLFRAIVESLENGLELGGLRDEAYIVPFGEIATLIPGYKGYISLIRRTGDLETITLEVVREGDEFFVIKGDDPRLVHTEAMDSERESRPITHAYCVCVFKDGAKQRNVWSTERINAHRDQYSKGYQAGERYLAACKQKKERPDPQKLSGWHTAWEVMAKKTVLRDLVNRGLVPISESYRTLIDRERYLDGEREGSASAPVALTSQGQQLLSSVSVPEKPPAAAEPAVIEGTAGAPQDILTDDAKEKIESEVEAEQLFERECRACKNLGEVTSVRDKWTQFFSGDEESQFFVAQACDSREEQIRAARGKSNA